jgi:hypothetical protein
MGVQSGRNPPGVLDGLYGVQLRQRPPQAQNDDGADRTSFNDSSNREHQNDDRTVTQQQQRLLIR